MQIPTNGWLCYACRKSCISKALEVMPAPKQRRREGRPESGRSGRRRIGAGARRST
jgi:hypothetical protein